MADVPPVGFNELFCVHAGSLKFVLRKKHMGTERPGAGNVKPEWTLRINPAVPLRHLLQSDTFLCLISEEN
jgi:hypothetical protein